MSLQTEMKLGVVYPNGEYCVFFYSESIEIT